MILDSLKNKERYASLHPRFKTVFDFIDTHDIAAMECGRHDIDGDDVFVNVQELDLRDRSQARLELHRKYIDIQLLLRGPEEVFGWSEKKDLSAIFRTIILHTANRLFNAMRKTAKRSRMSI